MTTHEQDTHTLFAAVTLTLTYDLDIRNSPGGSDDMPTQPPIPLGSVNEYQLRLGRQRQVWYIPLADERGVFRFKTVRSLKNAYLSVLEVCSRQGAIQIHVYITFTDVPAYQK